MPHKFDRPKIQNDKMIRTASLVQFMRVFDTAPVYFE